MCGISGFVHYDKARIASRSVLRRMSSTLVHRGPDGQGLWVDGNVALGHQRLAIIDLSSGEQPMASRNGSIRVTFNGEIYNFVELRRELEDLGHTFTTNSDTEVLIHAYEQWYLQVHDHLNGMWAFALWDKRTERLILSRDRIGEKPLFYAEFDESLLFGSECKALLAYGMPREPNVSLLEIYLTLGYIPAPFSFYKNIRKLEPGYCLIYERGVCSTHKHWDLPDIDERAFLRDEDDVDDKFAFLLRDSIRMRMRSDVAFGAFLSGGLDSSAVVSIMADHTTSPINTFTIGFNDSDYDERRLARTVARRFGTKHSELVLTPESLDESLDRVIRAYDEPFGDSSAIPVGCVSRMARNAVKMVLTGDGGDEVLSGYNSYQTEMFAYHYRSIPQPIRRVVSSTVTLASYMVPSHAKKSIRRIRSLLEAAGEPFNTSLLRRAAWIEPAIAQSIAATSGVVNISTQDFLDDLLRRCKWKDPFYRLMFYNFKLTLPNDMLTKVDGMSMAHSLEARAPFLDYRLVEHMVQVHKRVKMRNFGRKAVLLRTFGKSLPNALLKAPKRGFAVPLRGWFKERHLAALVEQSLTKIPVDFNLSAMRAVMTQATNKQTDFGNFLWMLVVLGKWFDWRPDVPSVDKEG
jgi:asparagine synthase (glutamine-hydrolysing)